MLHQVEPAFERAFATLSPVTYVAYQSNDFFLSENRKQKPVFSVQGFFTEWAQLLIIALDKAKQKGPLSNIFSTSQSVAVSNFINGPFEFPE